MGIDLSHRGKCLLSYGSSHGYRTVQLQPDPGQQARPALLPIHPPPPASPPTIRVEIIAATVAPVAQWIAELEQQYPEEGVQAL